MTPRHAVLANASEATLQAMVEHLGLSASAPRERGARMELLAGCLELSTRRMLDFLAEEELRAAARDCGLLGNGSRQDVILRLERRTGFEPVPRQRPRASRSPELRPPLLRSLPERPEAPFVALDFETADRYRDSACAVALVRVEGGEVVRREHRLIRPPRSTFEWTSIHGITWAQVRGEPTFAEVWPRLEPLLEGASFLAAHNAAFDRSVLEACCRAAGLPLPSLPFLCTVKLARQRWGLKRARLPDVCELLGIPLQHHDAASDAHACARIVLASAG